MQPKSQFEKTREYMACQQAVFIGFLNQEFTITLQRPVKRTHVSQQYINIKSIQRHQDRVDVESFVNKKISTRIKNKKLSRLTKVNKLSNLVRQEGAKRKEKLPVASF